MIDEFKRMPQRMQALVLFLSTVNVGMIVLVIVMAAMYKSPGRQVGVKSAKKTSGTVNAAVKAAEQRMPATAIKVPDRSEFPREIGVLAETCTIGDWPAIRFENQFAVLQYIAVVRFPKDSPDAHGFRVASYSVLIDQMAKEDSGSGARRIEPICDTLDGGLEIYFASKYVQPRID